MKYVLSRPDSFQRDMELLKSFFPLLGEGLLSSTGDYHRFQKKILGKAFATNNIKNYIPIFDKHVQVLVQVRLTFYCLTMFYRRLEHKLDLFLSCTYFFNHMCSDTKKKTCICEN